MAHSDPNQRVAAARWRLEDAKRRAATDFKMRRLSGEPGTLTLKREIAVELQEAERELEEAMQCQTS